MAALVIASLGATPASGAATDSLSLTTAPEYTSQTQEAGRSFQGLGRVSDPWQHGRVRGSQSVRFGATRPSTERCKNARKGLRYYRSTYSTWMAKRGARVEFRAKPSACPRYLLHLTVRKSRGARLAYERWAEQLAERLLDVQFAICYVFGGYCSQALRVVECESGGSRHAHNGQYLGIFQMGDYARSRYGHGETFLAQARAAYRYFVASGFDWSPWACKP